MWIIGQAMGTIQTLSCICSGQLCIPTSNKIIILISKKENTFQLVFCYPREIDLSLNIFLISLIIKTK
jgi:hypothetical protein